ncbi:DegT/DnrJ/EryC1/StrS family aminotransferase [Crateriforma conspicua]|uniref:Putative pyridoxal phosphate-dependent aminotransferase EpsN n=1 Tax=Crateriforma conspicua TaxID=2527996 RepID=A0A5C5Y5Y6_9PLAN|nr:DegT/DnrJ/EryC1/StrS family aminotransferase [Crateriforma conspicua]TWT70534.1 putative pyridoxal phosphate-dependent aminotransferase EpsN [Crateriforma conspicua]
MTDSERTALLRAFDSGWVAPIGPEIDAFETEFAERVGVRHAVALSSGTAALHLALLACGVMPGDRVAVSTLTFVASANVIRYVGAHPIFIDSEEASWNIDPQLLREEIREQDAKGTPIRAVIAVDLFGQCADYTRIRNTCNEFGVRLIEDAAEALGAQCNGASAGSFGEIGCFSFNGNKIITTSGGGMLVTNHAALAESVKRWATQSRLPTRHYEHSELGYNYRLSNLLAAIGRAQLARLDETVRRRRQIFDQYVSRLGPLSGIRFMPEAPGNTCSRWLTVALIDESEFGCGRDAVIDALEQQNIESRPTWKPMHLQALYEGATIRGGSVSERIFTEGVCLPSGTSMSDDAVDRVCDVVQATASRLTISNA